MLRFYWIKPRCLKLKKKNIIILLSEGRSGTNGLYRHIFANKMSKPEPYKDIPTKNVTFLKNH